jgi:hypothetical protein
MNTPPERQLADALLGSLEPFLNAETRKSAQAINGLLALFPGQSIPDIEKTIRSLLASARNSIPAFVERTRALAARSSGESFDTWALDLAKLNATDLKQVGKGLGIELKGAKAQNIADLRKWVESGGIAAPPDGAERARQAATLYTEHLLDRIMAGGIDSQLAQEIHRQAEVAAKALNKQEFEAFGRMLGIPVSGTKPAMLKQIKDFVDRAAVSYGQTKF